MPLHSGGVIPGDDLLPDDWDKDLLDGTGTSRRAGNAARTRPVPGSAPTTTANETDRAKHPQPPQPV